MAFEITGKLIVKDETVVVSDRFKKREFVILKEENNGGTVYSDHIKFQLTQDKCDLVESFQVEDEIKVSFNIKGNKWEKNGNTSYFTNLDAWRIEKSDAPSAPASASIPEFPGSSESSLGDDDQDGDLPF